jgi:protocatechuate 3,4-dioxygenase beta subunit
MVVGCEGQITPSASKQIRVGGACEGCELMYVGMPKEIKAVDTSAGWYEAGQKLWITGKGAATGRQNASRWRHRILLSNR